MSEEKMEQLFQVKAPARLVVKNIRGSVTINPGEETSLQVTAIKQVDSGDAELTRVELTQDADGTVEAVARYPEDTFGWIAGKKPCEVDFIIQAPSKCSTKVKVVSSVVSITGLEGEMECHTVSGDLVLHDLAGSFTIRTVSGDVEMEKVSGSMDIHTVSGDVAGKHISGEQKLDSVSGDFELKESTLPSVQSKSISGGYKLETPLTDGPYQFHTVSGDVKVKVPAETHCSLELHSLSGYISSKLPETSSQRDRGTQSVEVQGGGVKVTLGSVSGGLKLES
jgi:DUF4097 and DUF4098 domain-containing protein YvlB